MNWQAKWIWWGGEARPKNSYLYLRKKIQVEKEIATALVHVTADSRYKLYLNRQYLGRGPARCEAEVALPELGFAHPRLVVDAKLEPLGTVTVREGKHTLKLDAGR